MLNFEQELLLQDKLIIKNARNHLHNVGIKRFSIPQNSVKNYRVVVIVKELLTSKKARNLEDMCISFQKNDQLYKYEWIYENCLRKSLSEYFGSKISLFNDKLTINSISKIENALRNELVRILNWDPEIDERLIVEGMKYFIFNKINGDTSLLFKTEFYSFLKFVDNYRYEKKIG